MIDIYVCACLCLVVTQSVGGLSIPYNKALRQGQQLWIKNCSLGGSYSEAKVVALEDAGEYNSSCTPNDKVKLWRWNLIVLLSDPICKLDNSVVVEGDYVSMSCEVQYSGRWAPVMQWSSLTEDVTAINTTNATFVKYTVKILAHSQLNGEYFRCKTFFNLPKGMLDGYAKNIPNYVHEDVVGPLEVQFTPQDLNVLPQKHEYIPGDTLTIYAKANPKPTTYRWLELPSKTELSSAKRLQINKDMVGRAMNLLIQVHNKISDSERATGMVITFMVKAFLIPTVTGNRTCILPFWYKGKMHSTCTTEDTSPKRLWCATAHVLRGNAWDYCDAFTVTYEGNAQSAPCVFPFRVNGTNHTECIKSTLTDSAWCATTRDFDKDGKWGLCGITRPRRIDADSGVVDISSSPNTSEQTINMTKSLVQQLLREKPSDRRVHPQPSSSSLPSNSSTNVNVSTLQQASLSATNIMLPKENTRGGALSSKVTLAAVKAIVMVSPTSSAVPWTNTPASVSSKVTTSITAFTSKELTKMAATKPTTPSSAKSARATSKRRTSLTPAVPTRRAGNLTTQSLKGSTSRLSAARSSPPVEPGSTKVTTVPTVVPHANIESEHPAIPHYFIPVFSLVCLAIFVTAITCTVWILAKQKRDKYITRNNETERLLGDNLSRFERYR